MNRQAAEQLPASVNNAGVSGFCLYPAHSHSPASRRRQRFKKGYASWLTRTPPANWQRNPSAGFFYVSPSRAFLHRSSTSSTTSSTAFSSAGYRRLAHWRWPARRRLPHHPDHLVLLLPRGHGRRAARLHRHGARRQCKSRAHPRQCLRVPPRHVGRAHGVVLLGHAPDAAHVRGKRTDHRVCSRLFFALPARHPGCAALAGPEPTIFPARALPRRA